MRRQYGRAASGALLAAALLSPYGWQPPEAVAVADSIPLAPARYRCPMHPTYVAQKIGPCPLCGMSLVAVAAESPARTIAGRAPVSLSEDLRRRLGLRTDVVRRTHLVRTIRAPGRIVASGAAMAHPVVVTEVYES